MSSFCFCLVAGSSQKERSASRISQVKGHGVPSFIALNRGPDGDYYTSGIVASAPFSLPYAIRREYGWAEGGAPIHLQLGF